MTSERLGLILLLSVLTVIGCTGGLVLEHQRRTNLEQVRTQGTTLARVLSRIAPETLAPRDGHPGLISLLFSVNPTSSLRYARTVDLNEVPRGDVVASGVVIPHARMPATPAAWYAERTFDDPVANRRYREFHAPLLRAGELVGHLRIGFSEPGFDFDLGNLPGLAILALPIFLLAPVTYYLVRREIRPLRAASVRIQQSLDEAPSLQVELSANPDVASFIGHFNQFMESAKYRMRDLEDQRVATKTETKVIGYQKVRIESVLQSVPQGILVLDEATVVSYANDKLGIMLGLDLGTVVGEPLVKWCPEEALLGLLARPSAGTGSTHGTVEFQRDATRLEASAHPLRSPRGSHELLGTLVLVADVTSEANAKQAHQDLIAQLSHELKTPLHVINLYSEMLIEAEEGADQLRLEAGNTIHDEVERVIALINNILSRCGLHLIFFMIPDEIVSITIEGRDIAVTTPSITRDGDRITIQAEVTV